MSSLQILTRSSCGLLWFIKSSGLYWNIKSESSFSNSIFINKFSFISNIILRLWIDLTKLLILVLRPPRIISELIYDAYYHLLFYVLPQDVVDKAAFGVNSNNSKWWVKEITLRATPDHRHWCNNILFSSGCLFGYYLASHPRGTCFYPLTTLHSITVIGLTWMRSSIRVSNGWRNFSEAFQHSGALIRELCVFLDNI